MAKKKNHRISFFQNKMSMFSFYFVNKMRTRKLHLPSKDYKELK